MYQTLIVNGMVCTNSDWLFVCFVNWWLRLIAIFWVIMQWWLKCHLPAVFKVFIKFSWCMLTVCCILLMILFYKSTCVEYCVESCVESCLNLVWILFESCFESCVESCLNLVLNIVFNLWWIILRKNKYTQNSEGLPQFRKNYFGLY